MDSKGRERRGIFVQQQHPKVTSNDCFVSPPISFPGSGKGDLLRTAVTIIAATQRKKRLDGSWVDGWMQTHTAGKTHIYPRPLVPITVLAGTTNMQI